MKYFVLTEDELQDFAQETIYVFEHSKKDSPHKDIHTLEEFAAKCHFIISVVKTPSSSVKG